MPLDLSKLQNVKRGSNGAIIAGCPACAEQGRDHTHDHLIIYPDGRFGCLANTDDPSHRKRIWALVGDGTNGGTDSAPIQFAPQIEIERTWPADCLDRLIKDYSYWEGRNIREETIAPFRGGMATDGQMKGRWVIPIFNLSSDAIIGFTGRTTVKGVTPPWKHLGKTAKWVWGGIEEIEETRRAVLVESIADSLMLRQNGVPETLVLFGAKISETVIGHLIAANPDEIIVATNRDIKHTVGQDAAEKIAGILRKFWNSDKVRIALPFAEGKKDFGEMTPEEIAAWRESLQEHS